jgi:hypothetical protein
VGGGWGKVSEKEMMKDILRHGPMSIEFQANKLFQLYQEGILSEEGVEMVKDKTTQLIELKYQQQLEELAKRLLDGNSDPDQVLNALAQGDISLVQL